jgi:hypothetical protein
MRDHQAESTIVGAPYPVDVHPLVDHGGKARPAVEFWISSHQMPNSTLYKGGERSAEGIAARDK